MLWYKAWLETRWRVLLMFSVMLFLFFQFHSVNKFQARGGGLGFMLILISVILAGSGVRTDSPFRAVKRIQGSMYFTLSLPVSRLRLLTTRAAFGLVAIAGIIAIVCCLAGVALPQVRAQVTMADGLKFAATLFFCCTAVFGISTVFATFLDQQWQMIASMAVVFGGAWLFGLIERSGFDPIGALGNVSPLVTHSMPWATISASVAICLACLLTAWQIEKARQY